MILRFFRALVLPGREDRLIDLIGDRAQVAAAEIEGLRSFQPGIRQTDAGTELVIVSTWEGFEAIERNEHSADKPLAMPDAASMLRPGRFEHFELVWADTRALPVWTGILRIGRVSVQPRYEAVYFSELRSAAAELLQRAGLSALTAGRRTMHGQVDTIVAMMWDERASIERALAETGASHLFPSLTRYHAGPLLIEEFDALDPSTVPGVQTVTDGESAAARYAQVG